MKRTKAEIPAADIWVWPEQEMQAANQNGAPETTPAPMGAARKALRRMAVVAWLAIALGFLMQGLVLAGKISLGDRPAMTQIIIDLAQGVTWSFFVCAGVGLGTTIAKAHKLLGGLIGLIVAPLAMGIAKGSQKFMVSALAAADKPVLLPLATLGVIRAVEYGILGWMLASLAMKSNSPAWRFLLSGAVVGVIFGGSVTLLSVQNADAMGIMLKVPQIVALTLNETIFPIGCSLVVWIALQIGSHVKHMSAVK